MPAQKKRNAVKALVVGAVGAALCAKPAKPAGRAYLDPVTGVLGGWLDTPQGDAGQKLGSNIYNQLPSEIDSAAIKLSNAAYPFMQDVDWKTTLYLSKPGGTASALDWLKAIDKALEMGMVMDSGLLKKAAMAHHDAIATVDNNGLLSKGSFTEINKDLGKLIASVPADKTMAVYNSFKELVGADVPAYLMSTVKEEDAKIAYKALMEFKDVVKKNKIEPVEPVVSPLLSPTKLAAVDKAAGKMATASYPFIKDIDWTSELYTQPLPGVDGLKALKAIDSMIVLGASMDGKLLKDAVGAHHKAIAGVDAKGVLTEADYKAVTAGIGKIIASAPQSKVMDVYNSFAKILDPSVGNNLFSMFSKGAAGADALAAYKALLDFKEVVKAAEV